MADVLGVPISYFFGDLSPAGVEVSVENTARREQLELPETIALVRLYYAIPDQAVRRHFLDLVKAVAQSTAQER